MDCVNARAKSFSTARPAWPFKKSVQGGSDYTKKVYMSGWFVVKGPKSCACAFCDSKRSEFALTDDPTAGHTAECPSGAFWSALALADPHSDESARLRTNTFTAKWPFAGVEGAESLQADKMAAAGFVYAPDVAAADNALCPYCDVSLEGWEIADDPTVEHRKRAKKCPFFVVGASTSSPSPAPEAKPAAAKRVIRLRGKKAIRDDGDSATPAVVDSTASDVDAKAASAAEPTQTDTGHEPSVVPDRISTPKPTTPNVAEAPIPPGTPVAHRTPILHTECISPHAALFTPDMVSPSLEIEEPSATLASNAAVAEPATVPSKSPATLFADNKSRSRTKRTTPPVAPLSPDFASVCPADEITAAAAEEPDVTEPSIVRVTPATESIASSAARCAPDPAIEAAAAPASEPAVETPSASSPTAETEAGRNPHTAASIPVKRAASPDATLSRKAETKRKKVAPPTATIAASNPSKPRPARATRAKPAHTRKPPFPASATLMTQPTPGKTPDEPAFFAALAPFLPPQPPHVVGGSHTTMLPQAAAELTLEELFTAQAEAARIALRQRRRNEWHAAEREFDKLEMWIRTRPEE
ncbi:hypothetical protein HDU87_005063 [Geranomyces variabilis]|uniref:BIR-domain-containing protein n=1 Tax=Geranomyces variabilis TaxID=109894 RepID=A0AAD5TR45_9FUNG|nr:hypothetical protein HDU87_005063 [Geranomyces variabilis]